MFRRSRLRACDRPALTAATLCLTACVLATGPAAALDCSAIILDKGNLLAFGQAQLGDPRSRLPADASAARNCGQTCSYTDSGGVTYVVRGDEIIGKEISDVSRYRGALPARISAGESLSIILKRLAAVSEGAPIWSLNPLPGGGLLLRTDNCIEGNNGVRGSYGFTFDRDGRLSAISAEIL
jgi:hypothetical protein